MTTIVAFFAILLCLGLIAWMTKRFVDRVIDRWGLLVLLALSLGSPAQGADAFLRGDSNQSGRVDNADPIHVMSYLFQGGDTPSCLRSADVNADDAIDIADAISLLSHLYSGGEPPSPPYPRCGVLPVNPELSCLTSSCDAYFRRGDVDLDGFVLVEDFWHLHRALLNPPAAELGCLDAADLDDDGDVDGFDGAFLAEHLFGDRRPIPAPWHTCSWDQVQDELGCDEPCNR